MSPTQHPNTVVNLLTGTGGGSLVVAVLHYYDIHVSPENAILIAGALGSFFLFIGRRGIRGTISAIWHGSDKPPAPPTTLAPPPTP